MGKQAAPSGYGFCPTCGGLFKLTPTGGLPAHVWVGRGNLSCVDKLTAPDKEGEVSP